MDGSGSASGSGNVVSSTAENSAANDPSNDPKRKASSNDPGWKYAYWPDLTNKTLIRCSLCGKDLKQGIKRVKRHLAGGFGDVAKCPKVSAEISREMHQYILNNKRKRLKDLNDPDDDLNVPEEVQDEGQVPQSASPSSAPRSSSSSIPPRATTPSSGTAAKQKKAVVQPQVRGPMDVHVRRTPEQVVDERRDKSSQTQTTIENRFRSKEQKKIVDNHIADWFYEYGIAFNTAKSRSFEIMVESIAQYGSGYKPPSYHELRVPLLKTVTEKTLELRGKYETYWKEYGCTLMSDGWTDKRGRHLINFLVNCPEGTFFLGSIDASQYAIDANLLFQLLDNKIEEIGAEHVVQVISNNAGNYRAAGKLLMEKRRSLYWTPCAAHCLDLMLEEIGKLSAFQKIVVRARKVITFIYRHTRLLEATRSRTGGKDLVRAGVTRFATSFLTLKSLLKHKDALKQLFVSDDWRHSNLSKTEAGKRVADTLLAVSFWNGVEDCLRASQPIVVVLRLVDGDERPALPEVYLAIKHARKKLIEHFDQNRQWQEVVQIFDRRWDSQMDRPLYAAALFLNPGSYFQFCIDEPENKWIAQEAFNEVLIRMVPEIRLQDKIFNQAFMYKTAMGSFSKELAIRQRTTRSPFHWWSTHGGQTVELTTFAMRILGLCCSSSGCERNWSTFEFIHTKKRNRLEHQRLNDLVFVQYDRRLQERFKERREQGRNYNPLMLDELDWSSEWMIGCHQEDLVHDDLTWTDVDRAMGASESIEGHNRPRRTQASTSTANVCYERRVRGLGRGQGRGRGSIEGHSNAIEEDEDEEEDGVDDDEDIEDDFGRRPMGSTVQEEEHERQIDSSLIDDLD